MLTTHKLWVKITSPLIRELYAVCLTSQILIMYGVTVGYSTCILPQLMEEKEQFQLTDDNLPWIGISGTSFRIIGAIIDTTGGDIVGRIKILQLCFLCFAIGWMTISISTNARMLICARMFNSVFCGMTISSGTYIAEISADKRRAVYMSLFPVFITIGGESVYIVSYAVGWKLTAVIIAGYSAVIALLLSTIPESPYWYAMHNRVQKVKQSMLWFDNKFSTENHHHQSSTTNVTSTTTTTTDITMRRNSSENIRLHHVLQRQPSVQNKFHATMKNRKILGRILTTASLIVCLQFTGYLSVNGYNVQLFETLNPSFDGRRIAIAFGFVSFLCNLLMAFLVVTKLPRKDIIATASLATTIIATIVLIIFQYSQQHHRNDDIDLSYPCAIGVFLYFICLYSGCGNTLWVIIPEMFPTILRNTIYGWYTVAAMVLIAAISAGASALIREQCITILVTIAVLSSISIAVITIFFLPPETGNIPFVDLETIDNLDQK